MAKEICQFLFAVFLLVLLTWAIAYPLLHQYLGYGSEETFPWRCIEAGGIPVDGLTKNHIRHVYCLDATVLTLHTNK